MSEAMHIDAGPREQKMVDCADEAAPNELSIVVARLADALEDAIDGWEASIRQGHFDHPYDVDYANYRQTQITEFLAEIDKKLELL